MDRRDIPEGDRQPPQRQPEIERTIVPSGDPTRELDPMDTAPGVAERPTTTSRPLGGADRSQTISSTPDPAADRTRDALSEAGDRVSATADRAADRAADLADRAGDRVAHMADRASDVASDLAGAAADKAANAVDRVEDTLSSAGHRVASGAESLKDRAGAAMNEVPNPGPVLGSVLGALAGSIGGWWLGRSEPDVESGYTEEDERHYREHFESHRTAHSGMGFDRARVGYVLGHMAARNPAYHGRDFEDVELELRQGFRGDYTMEYEPVRPFVRYAFERREGGVVSAIVGGLAGALGGWWAASTADASSAKLPEAEDEACRVHFATITPSEPGLTYESARPIYTIGFIAARNPSYQGRTFDEIEPDLRRGFTGEYAARYDSMREYARHGYERGTTSSRK
jgi:hypothetical protein